MHKRFQFTGSKDKQKDSKITHLPKQFYKIDIIAILSATYKEHHFTLISLTSHIDNNESQNFIILPTKTKLIAQINKNT
jgi:hypothetical protein